MRNGVTYKGFLEWCEELILLYPADYLLVRWDGEETHSIVQAKRTMEDDCQVGGLVWVDFKAQGVFTGKVLYAGRFIVDRLIDHCNTI